MNLLTIYRSPQSEKKQSRGRPGRKSRVTSGETRHDISHDPRGFLRDARHDTRGILGDTRDMRHETLDTRHDVSQDTRGILGDTSDTRHDLRHDQRHDPREPVRARVVSGDTVISAGSPTNQLLSPSAGHLSYHDTGSPSYLTPSQV